MPNQLEIEVVGGEQGTVLSVSGELDLASSHQLEHEVDRALDAGASVLVIDLRGLDFMDSTGLSLLIKARERAEERSCRLAIVQGSSQVQRLLALTGVAERLSIVEDPAAALES